jgi:hypothetical protein
MHFEVLDSQDKRVGDFISLSYDLSDGSGGFALVQLKINNKYYTLPVYRDRIGETPVGTLDVVLSQYTLPNCQGQPYVEYNEPIGLISTWRLTSLGWINQYPKVTPQIRTIVSYTPSDGTCNSFPEEPRDVLAVTLEACLGPDFRAGFAAPFRFE